tara:strand:- start:32407 stop:33762 length:1356 start_codon:yes stop_codon:yes gene_type:complete
MKYVSTRGQTDPLTFSEAVATGLAPDGGLLIPETMPDLAPYLKEWEGLSYPDLCEAFFSLFATDIAPETLKSIVQRSYLKFDHPDIAPLRTLERGLHVFELFHGPSLAFKDFALQLLGNFYEEQIARTGKAINVLGATSGDTGAAAIHGLLGKKGVKIFILYPDGGVSPLQERQMTTTGADNVYAIAIDGAFDDAQNSIKAIFGDLEFRHKYNLSAVNSINLARVLAQCVYYLYAWFRLPADEREIAEFVVPTGNFGNVLAGWMVQQMGVPMGGFCVATNQNDILCRLFQTGSYSMDAVAPSHAPSMDIQIASNFERFLWFHEGKDGARVREVMEAFKASGSYDFENFDKGAFRSCRADDGDIEWTIRDLYEKYDYVVDPHTACGFVDISKERPTVIMSTAHPAKFADVIEKVLGKPVTHPALEALKEKEQVKYPLPATDEAVKDFLVKHI